MNGYWVPRTVLDTKDTIEKTTNYLHGILTLIGKTHMGQIITQKYISCKPGGRKKSEWVYERRDGGEITEGFPEEVTQTEIAYLR